MAAGQTEQFHTTYPQSRLLILACQVASLVTCSNLWRKQCVQKPSGMHACFSRLHACHVFSQVHSLGRRSSAQHACRPPPPGPRSLGPLLPFVLSLPMMRRASIKASWYLEKAYFREVSSEPVAACHGMLQQSASYWPYFDQDRLNCHCWCRELNPPDGVQKFVYHRQVRELRCPLFNNQMGLLAPAAACSMI